MKHQIWVALERVMDDWNWETNEAWLHFNNDEGLYSLLILYSLLTDYTTRSDTAVMLANLVQDVVALEGNFCGLSLDQVKKIDFNAIAEMAKDEND